MTEHEISPVHRSAGSSKASEIARRDTTRAMQWSLWVGFFMFALKIYAYAITQSAAILSDAAESVVHVLAVSFAAYSLWLSNKPADRSHLYGHDRISFFSAGFEGAMIVIAAFYIIYEAVMKWIHGLHLENIESGTAFVAVATIINALLGWYLVRQGRRHNSIILEANGKHVLTDSYTSLGVIVGLLLTMWTGWLPFDPLVAILVAVNILWSGTQLMRRSIGGLMDEADPDIDRTLTAILREQTAKYGIVYHDLRHRNAGRKVQVEFHLLFPDSLSIAEAHEQATEIETLLQRSIPCEAEITTHLEPLIGHDRVHQTHTTEHPG